MKKTRKILSVILSLVMVISALPLTAITAFADADVIVSGDGEWRFRDVGNGEAWLVCGQVDPAYTGDDTIVTIPNYIADSSNNDYEITGIDDHAFSGMTDLEKIIMSNSIKHIGQYAFSDCPNLLEVEFPDRLDIIEDYAFYNCPSLTEVTLLDPDTTMGQYCLGFYDDNGTETEVTGFTINTFKFANAYDYTDGYSMIAELLTPVTNYLTAETIYESAYGTASTLNGARDRYFQFTPDEDGTYAFYSENYDDDYAPTGYLYDNDGELLSYDVPGDGDNFRIEYSLEAYETYILVAKNYGVREYEYSVSVEKLASAPSATPITLDTVTLADITDSDYYDPLGRYMVFFSFTPAVSGTYYFEGLADSDTYGYAFDSYMNQIAYDDDSGSSNNNFRVTCTLTSGELYYFGARYYSDRAGSFNVQLTKALSATSIYFEEGDEGEGNVYDTVYLNVGFLPDGAAEEVCTFESDDTSVAEVDYSTNTYCEVNLVGAGTATITATSENGLTADYEITVNALPELTLNTPCTFSLSDYYSSVRYAFSPDESCYYYINNTQDASVEIYRDGSYITGGNGSFSVELDNGYVYAIKFSYFSGSNTVTVSKCVTATGITFDDGSSYTGYAGTTKTLYANIGPADAIPESISFTSSDDSVVSIGYADSDGTNRYYCSLNLLAVGTATIIATGDTSGVTASYSVTVDAVPTLTLDTPYTFDLTNGSSGVASFTPSENGTYAFTFSDFSNGTYLYKWLEDENQNYIGGTSYTIFSAALEAGKTYTLKTENGYNGIFKVTVTKLVPATGLVFTTEPGYTEYPNNSTTLYAKFTPDNAIKEDVTFTSSDDTIVSIEGNYFNETDNRYECYVSLLASGTATVTATSESGKTATYEIVVKSYPALTLDVPYTVNMTDGNSTRVQFTPSEDGQYKFIFSDFSNGSSFYKSLQSANGSYITYTYGTSIGYNLTAGTTYLIYLSGNYGIFKVTASKCVAATGIAFVEEPGQSDYQYSYASLSARLTPDNAIDETITFTSGDTNVVEVTSSYKSEDCLYSCDLKLKNAGTATITAETQSGFSATYSYTVESIPALTLNTPYGIVATDYGAENVVAFTPAEDGLYKFTSTYPCYRALYEGFNNITDSYSDITIELEAGKTYLMKLSRFTGTANVSVTKCVAASSLTFDQASYRGFEYRTLFLSAQLNPDNAIPEGVTFSSSNTDIAAINGYGSNGIYSYLDLKLLEPGTVTITATSSDTGLTATCTVTVQAMPVIAIDQKTEFTSRDSNDDHYYKFTPTVSGYYFFNAEEYSDIYVNDTDGNNVDYTGGYTLYTYLTTGTTYILNVTGFNGLNSMTIKRAVNATSMSLTESSYQGYEYTWYNLGASFAPDNAIAQGASFVSTDTDVVAIESQYDGQCDLRLLTPGTATINATSDSGLTASCVITVLPLTSITLDTPYTLSSSSYREEKYVKFIPSETAYYYFRTSRNCNIQISEGFNSMTGGYGTVFCELQVGKTYVIRYDGFTGSNIVTVTKAVPATSLDIQEDTVVAYPFNYEYITADFGPGDCIPEEVNYTSSAPDVVEINYAYLEDGQSHCTLKLLKPGTATITATSENGLTDTCSVTVKPLLVLTEDTLTQVEIVNNSTECYSFTPSQSGTYFFRISDYSNQNEAGMYLSDGFDSLIETGYQSFNINLVAGKTYIFRTRYNSWYTSTGGSGTFNVYATLATAATSINLSKDAITGYVGTTKDISASFEPWNAIEEGYVYSSSDESIVTVDSYGTVRFVSGGTATITVTSNNGLTDTCTVTSKNLKVLTAGIPEMAVITGYGEYEYYTFTAPESGYYVFYSSADGEDTFAYMYDADMNNIDDDDDGGVGYNFRIKREMTAGETYIFSTGLYDGEEAVYPVVIEKKKVVTDIDILQMPDKTEYVKGYVNEGFDPEGLVLKFTWSDSTTTRYVYNPENPIFDGLEVEVSPYVYNNGNSARIQVTYDGVSAYGALTLIDSPVASIELVYNDVVTYVENCGGYRDSYWNMAAQVSEYYYHYQIMPDDITVRINYKDGTSAVANVNDYVDGIRISFSEDQYDNHWTVGGYNSFTVSYIDQSVQVPVIIVPNGVDSIDIVTPTATTFIENCGGHVSNAWDPATGTSVPFYYYNLWDADFSDAVVRINYTDGTSETANYGDFINGYPITYIDNQAESHWTLGTNTLTVSYMGATATMNVTVVETPVRQIEVSSPPQKTYYFGDTAFGRSIASGNVTYYQLNNFIISGLSFTVINKNGTNVNYTDADIDENGRINGYPLVFVGCEYPNGQLGLTGPGQVKVKWNYMGVEFSYNISVLANPVSSIQIISQPDIASSNGNFTVEPYGLSVRINYADSSSSQIIFNQNNTEMHFDGLFAGGGVYYTVNVDGNDMVYYRTWTGNAWRYVVEYVGASAVLNGTPSDADVTDLGILNFVADCDGMDIEMCFADGTSATLNLEVLEEINEFADGTAYIVRTSQGVMTVFIAPLRDGNNQITSYWVEAGIGVYYYLNLPIVAGDIDQDGDADLADYDVIRAYLSGESITSSKLADADINGDGAVDAFDLFELDRIINNTLANKFTYSEIDTASARITAYNGSDAELTLPKYYLSRTITTIGQNAFKGKTSLAEVTLCDTITTLDNYAFMNCSNLESVKFNSGLQSINYGAFLNCTSLEKITLPNSVTTIGSNAFKGCTSLEYVALSNGITSLSTSNIFANCTALKTVIIPDSVTSINANTFVGCGSQLTIYGKAGSAAETFANAQGINFVVMG